MDWERSENIPPSITRVTHLLGGMKGRPRLEPGHALPFGTYVTRLGTREAASPIVETRQARLFWLGYAWDL